MLGTTSDGWRGKLYVCSELDFPLFARFRTFKELLNFPGKATVANFARVIIPDKSTGEVTAKNILLGRVKGNPHFGKGVSLILPEHATNLSKHFEKLNRPLPSGALTERMTEKEFYALIENWHANIIRVEDAASGPSDVPHMPGLALQWSAEGHSQRAVLDKWWTARCKNAARATPSGGQDAERSLSRGQSEENKSRRQLEAQKTIGLFAPARFGKTVLLSEWIRSQSIGDVCWIDCRQVQGHEFLIDAMLTRLIAQQQGLKSYTAGGYLNAKLEDKKRELEHRLERFARGLIVFDSAESLVVDPGELPSQYGDDGERPKDQMAIDLLQEFITRSPVPMVFVSRHSLSLLPHLHWLELKEPAWRLELGAHPFPTDNPAQQDLAHIVQPPRFTNLKNSLSAEAIVGAIFRDLSPEQLRLFSFIVLIGERVRFSTLIWFCIDDLGIAAGQAPAFIESLWRKCAGVQAVVFTMQCDLEHDRAIDSDLHDPALHFKFHDTITEIAAHRLEAEPENYRTSEIHLKIAERARRTMRELRYYAAKNVVGRFTRPAQLVKHLAASIRVSDLRNTMARYEATAYLIPPDEMRDMHRDNLEKTLEIWEDGGIFHVGSSVERRYLYGFDLIYGGVIDRSHQLSRVNGADNAKLDLLCRLFPPIDSATSFAKLITRERAIFPALPVDLLTDLLAAMAVAGLNAGRLQIAKWASQEAMNILADWQKHFGKSNTWDRLFAFLTRLRVDILTRSGDLVEASALCAQSLSDDSAFRIASKPGGIQQLQLRYAHIIYMTSNVTGALAYLAKIGLDIPEPGLMTEANNTELKGVSGRIWVALLLKTMKGGRHGGEDAATLQWASRLLERNGELTLDRGANERVALMVQRSIIDRISVEAIRARRQDIIDIEKLPECRKLLRAAERLAWNSGVSPATRIELEFEIARVDFLQGHYTQALEMAERLEKTTAANGYRIYQFEAIFLRGEILWEMGELARKDAKAPAGQADQYFCEAENLMTSLVVLERETHYTAAHAARLLLFSGVSPTRNRIL